MPKYRKLRFEAVEPRRVLAQFIVTSLNDGPVSGPGDQLGTLRQAIFDANFESLGPDTIVFSPTTFPVDGLMQTILLEYGRVPCPHAQRMDM